MGCHNRFLSVLDFFLLLFREPLLFHIAEVEEEFGVKGKVIAYTTDNEATMHKAFKDDVRMGCLAHIESKASKNALKNQKCLNKLRSKCRRVVKYAEY